jgi:hypothetical protein
MITEAVWRFAKAQQAVRESLVYPTTELLEATSQVIAEARLDAKTANEILEQMRPHWAQGYADDSMAAQASTGALSEIWTALGVDNQTDAMDKIRTFTGNNEL